MVNQFENADYAKPHAQSCQSTRVSNECNEGHFLIFQDFCVIRILDVNFDDSQIMFCVAEHEVVKSLI